MQENRFRVIGVMSGTSLDGLDIALCEFTQQETIQYHIIAAKTYPYSSEWKQQLSGAHNLDAKSFLQLHKHYGNFIGQTINHFLSTEKGLTIDLIASHGHTIFHEPDKKLNFQLGDGAFIAAETKITTISDFRTLDIALGGQGAPLVPIGDELLFGDYDYCLNIGGIANISYKHEGKRIAYDICPANMVLNSLAQKLGFEYDKDGNIARTGKIQPYLFEQLNNLDYYFQHYPKSLGREWVEQVVFPVLHQSSCSIPDKLATFVEHIAYQISKQIKQEGKLLITGGGAHHSFLTERIANLTKAKVIIPDKLIVDYKEALIFAFIGYLRWQRTYNVLHSVTGAIADSVSGIVHIIPN